MSLFELPEDFNPALMVYKLSFSLKDEYPDQFESDRLKEVKRLNKIGSIITDYLALIQSGTTEISHFQALSLAVELYKIEALRDIKGNVDVSGGMSIYDGVSVSVSGHIETSEYESSLD